MGRANGGAFNAMGAGRELLYEGQIRPVVRTLRVLGVLREAPGSNPAEDLPDRIDHCGDFCHLDDLLAGGRLVQPQPWS